MVRRAQRGFTYLTALFMVAVLSGGLALAGEAWNTSAKRQKELELLFIGHQYRRAIERYYESTPGVKRYPRALQELLADPRQPSRPRHLRRLYADPFGNSEWGLVKAPDGGISGVYSLSEEAPLKTGNFRLRDAGFESAKRYADWKFVYSPAAAGSAPARPASRPPA